VRQAYAIVAHFVRTFDFIEEKSVGTISRFLALAVGALLVGYPLLMLSTAVPVPGYRTGTYADYRFAALGFLAIYGGVLLGILIYWLHLGKTGRKLTPVGVFRAGFFAEFVLSFTVVLGSGFYSLIASGSFDEGIGNLGGAILILWLMLGTAVSAGLALLFYGFQAPTERATSPLEALFQRGGVDEYNVKCPSCGSVHVQEGGPRWNGWIIYAAGGVISLTCLDCGHRFAIGQIDIVRTKPLL